MARLLGSRSWNPRLPARPYQQRDGSAMIAELVCRARDGDADAYTALVRRFQSAVYATAYHTVLDFDAARDIAQDTFIRAYESLGRLQDPTRFPGWVLRICHNLSVSWLRRPERHWVSLDQVHVSTRDPASSVAAKDLVTRALSTLPKDNRLALSLFLVNGYSYQEIAQLTESALTTVKGRIQRAKRKLETEVLAMTEDTLKSKAPDEEFTLETIRQSVQRAQELADAQRMLEARTEAETALAALDKVEDTPDQLWELRSRALGQLRRATDNVDGERWTEATREAIGLCEERGEPVSGLVRSLGYHGSGLTQTERDALVLHAVELSRQAGEWETVGQDLFFRGWHCVDRGDFQQGFALWEQACEAMQDLPYNSWHACLDATDEFLRLTGGKLDRGRMVHWGATCDVMVANGDRIAFRSQPGFCTHTGVPAEMMKFADGFGLLWWIGWYPHAGPAVGYQEEKQTFSYTGNPTHTRSWIESDCEAVSTPAGEFEGCLLLRATTTESPLDADVQSQQREITRRWRVGEKHVWFARGFGPVAYRFESVEGLVEHALLAKFECPEQREEWVPLVQGTRWEYVPAEPGEDFDALAVRILTHKSEDGTCYLAGTTVGNRRG
jgi:RNA polymerase sigma-70 factor, ECF subfamily